MSDHQSIPIEQFDAELKSRYVGRPDPLPLALIRVEIVDSSRGIDIRAGRKGVVVLGRLFRVEA